MDAGSRHREGGASVGGVPSVALDLPRPLAREDAESAMFAGGDIRGPLYALDVE